MLCLFVNAELQTGLAGNFAKAFTMKSNPFIRLVSSVSLILILMIPWQVGAGLNTNQLLKKVTLPPGFKIKLYAEKVPNARSMTLSPSGTVFVGTRKKGNVYAVMDKDQDQKADEVLTILYRLDVCGRISLPNLHCRIWFLESQQKNRLPYFISRAKR